MTIRELRDVFTSDTEIYVVNSMTPERIKINNLLMGTEFADIQINIRSIESRDKDMIVISTYMPPKVFEAWSEYSKLNEENSGEFEQ